MVTKGTVLAAATAEHGLAVGFGVYLLLLNPVTVESQLLNIFLWTTATVPTLLITGAVHYVLTKLWIIPRGLGGYPTREVVAAQAQ
jgi:nucleobase:cation symporter-1, NCS1 family